MYRYFLTAVLLIAAVEISSGQISPGELSEPHKALEGMDNCTQCHTIGKAISNDNCLNCHTEIKTRIVHNKGFHATTKSKECVECHKEHHGRNFTIIRFEKSKFDHSIVGYNLEGKHASLQCEKCHTRNKIALKDIQALSDSRKSVTYLGLSPECLSCHNDEHRGQFKAACIQCHTMNGWKPASRFSHDTAKFTLIGAHATVDCGKCHKKNLGNGTVTQFVHLEFGSCQSCHADPHKGKFKQECASCHTAVSWHQVKTSEFDHDATQFPLKGKHAILRCEQCHPKNAKEKNPSGSVGFHITRFQTCKNCHADAHGKQFEGRKDLGACESCHTEKGFTPATFSVADHALKRFTLSGAHLAVPCVQCHREGTVKARSTMQFRWDGNIVCTTCHTDIHKGQFKSMMTNGCETCHSTESWDAVKFSHDRTKFPLKGKHADVKCESCHKVKNGTAQFTGLPTACNQCHEDRHAGQFDKNNRTQCERCHTEKDWKSLLFDHNSQSRFVLTGKHETVKCEKCHPEAVINNKRTIRYKPLEAACVNCHPA